MNKLQAMRVFAQVVESGGFKRAAETLLVPKATVSSLIQQLEADLAVRLLHRTTRQVSVTVEGAAYYEQCVRILADISAVEESLSQTKVRPSGRLRVDTSSSFAQSLIIPALPEFTERYPDITLDLACGDREADLIEEGIDCAIRFGVLPNSALIARRIGQLEFLTLATSAYLEKHGRPQHPNDLARHRCVNYFSSTNGRVTGWNFFRNGERVELLPPGPVAVNDASSYASAGAAGLGIVHMPAYLLNLAFAAGQFERVLQDWSSDPLPVHVVYPQNRHLSGKVRVFVEWIIDLFARQPLMQTGVGLPSRLE
jgi:LysR family transcriptional regulator for bpeEF and oprC